MERHDIQPDWQNPENNGGFGGKPTVSRETLPAADKATTDEPKEEVNERPAKPKR